MRGSITRVLFLRKVLVATLLLAGQSLDIYPVKAATPTVSGGGAFDYFMGENSTSIGSGYVFTGWNTAADGSGTSYTDMASFRFDQSIKYLYPQWKLIQTKPTVTWPSPAAIIEGTALSATQLNATASVAGTFTYSPALNTVLPVGTQTLTVTFRPTDPRLPLISKSVNIDVAIDKLISSEPGAPVLPSYQIQGRLRPL